MKASTANVASYLKKISESNGNAITVCGYEAGPTGYRLCLDLQQQGFNCVIMAPTSIAKTAKDKILKTDRADAQMLARTLAYHSYKQVVLPTENILAIKEVVRLRASVLKSCKKAKRTFFHFYSITESHILEAEGSPIGR
ncbi:MAG: transposase [Acutalibacteraceae bacterium]|nr:transposase [Acutalibacteraceae bacterium]